MFQNEDKDMILIFLVVFWGKPIRDKAEGQYTNDINEENGCIINIKAKQILSLILFISLLFPGFEEPFVDKISKCV